LKGKRAVVVGAGQTAGESIGIGRATALLFAREGARVMLVDRDAASAEATQKLIVDEGGVAIVQVTEITSEPDCAAMAVAAKRQFGGVDVLINGVGIHGPGIATDLEEELWDRVLDVNLKGMWLTAKHVIPMMIEQMGGSIVNVSSIGAIRSGTALPYGVSKAGVNRLTLALAAAYADHDIRANAIMPGLVDTPMAIEGATERLGMSREEYVARRAAKTPMAYKGSAWDVAQAALYFASDESRFVSGNLLAVDGAMLVTR
jgi:NAD(P)-dependent dehydrogenase (short-subunit alcohol dehydrogenase family)